MPECDAMKTFLFIGVILAVIGTITPAMSAEPELSVYVTDANEDVFVAVYGNVAVQLVACKNVQEARTVLQLPAGTQARQTTLNRLKADFGYGAHPRIPCGPNTRFDIDWPATSPIWADLTNSGNYYFSAPNDVRQHYAVPSKCTGIKTALAIRERLQLPGVLQGLLAPEGLSVQIVLDCGNSAIVIEPVPLSDSEGWSLHRFDTFLTAESTGDTIYVARYRSSNKDIPPAYLPIWRTSNGASSEIILAGGSLALETETALKNLFGIPTTAPLTPLGAEAVAAVRSAVHVDLCVSNCEGYVRNHAVFVSPGTDLGLTKIETKVFSQRLSRLGEEQLVWRFEQNRDAVFTQCNLVLDALGLRPQGNEAIDWLASVDAGLLATSQPGREFVCRTRPAAICIRRVAGTTSLTNAHFSEGPDCPGASHLRVELPESVRMSGPILLSGSNFKTIELVPSPGVAQSIIAVKSGRITESVSACLLSSPEVLVFADGLPRLILHRLTLHRADGNTGGEVVAIQVQNGTLGLDNAKIGDDREGVVPIERGIVLCQAELYAVDSSIRASALAVQGIAARTLLSGTLTSPLLIGPSRVGLLSSEHSSVRLHHVKVAASKPVVLRGAHAVGTNLDLSSGGDSMGSSTGVELERGASATLTTSTILGFRCVAAFGDAGSKIDLILPGNNLARDNTHLACGPGQFTVME